MSGKAIIGHTPAELEVRLIVGETGDAVWVSKGPDGLPLAWSSAPVLHLPGDVTVTAALSAEGAVADARATWAITAEQVAAVYAVTGPRQGDARVKVGGRTLYDGKVTVKT